MDENCKKVYLLLTPEYGSMGDQAIAYAQEKYLKKNFPEHRFMELSEDDTIRAIESHAISRNQENLFFLQGGGNMGSLYPETEKRRQRVLGYLKENQTFIFPQSIYYEDNSWTDGADVYSNKNLTIYAREEISHKLMKRYYPGANVILRPDMVYGLTEYSNFDKNKRSQVFISLRGDKECLFKEFQEAVWNEMVARYHHVREYKMYSRRIVSSEKREEFVKESITELSKAKLLITDRLHGCIFAAITRTPCIVFPCVYHKIKGNYEWLKECKYIRLIEKEDLLKVTAVTDELLKLSEKDFEFELPHW